MPKAGENNDPLIQVFVKDAGHYWSEAEAWACNNPPFFQHCIIEIGVPSLFFLMKIESSWLFSAFLLVVMWSSTGIVQK